MENKVKNMAKTVGKAIIKNIGIKVVIIASIFILVAAIFYGVIDGILDTVTKVFDDVGEHVKIVGNNLELDEEYKKDTSKRLERMGVNPKTLNLPGDDDYLDKFLEAELVTNYPYLGGDGLQGTVYFERASSDGSTIELEYKEYDDFYAMKNSGNSDIYKYFTVDTKDWTVHVGKNANENNFDIEKINYKDMVSRFTMPFEFPLTLALVSENPQFGLAIVNLVKNSKMVVTIAESKTTTTTTTTYNYTQTIKRKNLITGLETETSEKKSETTVNTQESYYSNVFLSRAKTWIVNFVTDYNYEDITEDEEPQVTNIDENISMPYKILSEEVTVTNSDRSNTVNIHNRYQRWNVGASTVIENTKDFINLIKRDGSNSGGGLVQIAKSCHDYLAENKYTYETPGGHHFPETGGKTIDCSAYVSWVLKKAGYEIDCKTSTTLDDYGKSQGWEQINKVEDLQPGDIAFYDGHVNIFIEKDGSNYKFYDCGCTPYIQAIDPITYKAKGTMKHAYRPNDEIAKSLNPKGINDLKKEIENFIKNINNGTYSVAVLNLNNKSNNFTINDKELKSEGLLKIYIMATAYEEVENGNINESDIATEIDKMITSDNNDAANSILEKIGERDTSAGISKVNNFLSRNSYSKTKISEILSPYSNSDGTDSNYTSVNDVKNILMDIYDKKCINAECSKKMIEHLNHQIITNIIAKTISDGKVANKTGEQKDVLQDAAIISVGKSNYIITVMANGINDKEVARRNIQDISNMVYSYFIENQDNSEKAEEKIFKEDGIEYKIRNKKVCYNIPGSGFDCPLDELINGSDMIFEMLGKSEKTQSHEKIMRYLMYLLTSKDYGVSKFDFEDFVGTEFYGSTGDWEVGWNNSFTKEEFRKMVEGYNPPNTTGNGGRSCVDCYKKYFVANADNFYTICTKNGIDPRFIFAIGIHESYYGTSNIANTKGNFWGWGAIDSNPMGGAHSFNDMSRGIESVSSGLAKWAFQTDSWQYKKIKQNGLEPGTIDGIGSIYASDKNWANAVKKHMSTIFGYTGSTGGTDMQEKIVKIAKSQNTLGCKSGYCQKWVADVYAKAGQSRVSKACATEAANAWIVSTDKNNIPLGACVYGKAVGNARCGNHEAGHVGIYIGDGKVAHNVGGIKIESLDSWANTFKWKGWGWNGGVDYSKSSKNKK